MGKVSAFFASMAGKLALALLFAGLILLLLDRCDAARNAGKEADLATEQGEAAAESGRDAVNAAGGVSGRDAESDDLTRENDHAIHSAEGAGAPVPAAVADAARDGLCKRRAYRCTPDCLRRLAAAGVANPGAGCPDAGD